MIAASVVRETIVLGAAIEAPASRIFRAWSDPSARASWGAPSDDEAIEFLENDFRVGGRDIHFCGPKGDLRFCVETVYHDVVEATRLLFTESVFSDDRLLCVSLVSVQLFPNSISESGEGTNLELAAQVVSLVGEGMIAGNRGGWAAALKNLSDYLKSG